MSANYRLNIIASQWPWRRVSAEVGFARLEHHRRVLIWKCEDLTAEQLRRRAVPPSSLSLLGLVRHMAEVERGWFRQVFLGEDVPDLYDRSADEDADFNDVDRGDPAEAFTAFER